MCIRDRPKPGVFDMVPESEGGAAPDAPSGHETQAIDGPRGAAPGQPGFAQGGQGHDQSYSQAPDQRWGQGQQGGYPVDGGDQPPR